MADPQQILSDPTFHSLPLGERLKVMRTVDPNFAALHPKEQGTVLYQAAQNYHPTPTGEAGPDDEGFLSTLGSDIFHLPLSLLRMANPVTASQDVVHGMKDLGGKALTELHSGNIPGALGYGTAAAVPFIGPQAAQAGEEFGAGQYGQGSAHALEALLPFLHEPVGAGAMNTARGVRGAYRGAKAAPHPSLPMTFVGEQLGQAMGHPVAGTAIGAALPKIIPSIKGFFKGFGEGPPAAPLPPLPDYTMGGNELSIPGIGPRPQPAPPPPLPALPDYTLGGNELSIPGIGPRPPQPPTPPTPADLSGFTANPAYHGPVKPVDLPPPVPPPTADMTGFTMNPAYHGAIKPVTPSTVDIGPSVEKLSGPVQPVQPQGEIATGLHLPEVPKHYAGEPNPTAAFKNDQAIVAELRKVPGITQDTLTPEMVHEVRKSLGQRKLKDVDVERRVNHIRQMLSK
jgi:hypothetical protein